MHTAATLDLTKVRSEGTRNAELMIVQKWACQDFDMPTAQPTKMTDLVVLTQAQNLYVYLREIPSAAVAHTPFGSLMQRYTDCALAGMSNLRGTSRVLRLVVQLWWSLSISSPSSRKLQ